MEILDTLTSNMWSPSSDLRPLKTLDAYRDHGAPAARLEQGVAEAEEALKELSQLDIDLDEVTRQLEAEGIEKFNKPYDALMEILAGNPERNTSP